MSQYKWSTITACALLFLTQLPANAARQALPGGIATVDCIIHSNGTEVVWSVSVSDSSRPILYYNLEVKVAGGEKSQIFRNTGNFQSISKTIFFKGYRKLNVSATLEGLAGGANSSGVYIYEVPTFATECLPAYQP